LRRLLGGGPAPSPPEAPEAGAARPPRPAASSRQDAAAGELERARGAFHAGEPERADRLAASALAALAAVPEAPGAPVAVHEQRAALESALLAIRGGAAARAGRLAEANGIFEESRERAIASRNASAIAAAALNLVDVGTRQGRRDLEDPRIDEAARAGAEGPFEDLLNKLIVERGLAAIGDGQLEAAMALFDRVIASRPAWPFPWYQRAWTRFLRGDASGALEDYRECARRRCPFFTVQREIRCLEDVASGALPLAAYRSYCLLRDRARHQPAAVDEATARLAERHPEFAPAHLLRAETRLALGDPAGAREAARETLRRDPDPDTAAAALFLEWNLARGEGRRDALRETEDRLLEAYGDSPAAEIVRRLRASDRKDVVMRWTWALDGTFRLDEGIAQRAAGGPGTS